MKRYVKCLTIAGSDSGGGAGIQADIKTMSALGVFGMSAITAITAQNTIGVTKIGAVPADLVKAQIDAVLSDIGADAVKIGMIYLPETAWVIVELLEKYSPKFVVLDPVLVSSTNCDLSTKDCCTVISDELMQRSTIITPNKDEAEKLSGIKISSKEDMKRAACILMDKGAKAVLIKGGHLIENCLAADFLVTGDGTERWFSGNYIASGNTHGTGCSLSSAIASYLALGYDINCAITKAKEFITAAILNGCDVKNGKGIGAVNHFYAPIPLIKL
ncbi:MAG: bifunctional hydroxymethylpyrimidine kinase/phosphomethylpyrimidine kinase [Bacteroidales bacterium]